MRYCQRCVGTFCVRLVLLRGKWMNRRSGCAKAAPDTVFCLADEGLVVMPQQNGKFRAVRTCGDGACALHAVFGTATGDGVLAAPNARELAVRLLGPSEKALQDAEVPTAELTSVKSSLWGEFAVPAIQGENASVEAAHFWAALQLRLPRLVEEAQRAVADTRTVDAAAANALKAVQAASRSFFQENGRSTLSGPWPSSLSTSPPSSTSDASTTMRGLRAEQGTQIALTFWSQHATMQAL